MAPNNDGAVLMNRKYKKGWQKIRSKIEKPQSTCLKSHFYKAQWAPETQFSHTYSTSCLLYLLRYFIQSYKLTSISHF